MMTLDVSEFKGQILVAASVTDSDEGQLMLSSCNENITNELVL